MHKPIDLGYWVERDFNAIEDRRILRHLDELRHEVTALLVDDDLLRPHQQGVTWRRERIAQALTDHGQLLLFTWLAQSPCTPVLSMELQLQLHRLRMHAPRQRRHRQDSARISQQTATTSHDPQRECWMAQRSSSMTL